MQVTYFTIFGMDNRGCADVVTKALLDMGGVRAVDVSHVDGRAMVQFDELLTSPEQLRLAIVGSGYNTTKRTLTRLPERVSLNQASEI